MPSHLRSTDSKETPNLGATPSVAAVPDVTSAAPEPVHTVTASTDIARTDAGGAPASESLYAPLQSNAPAVARVGTPTISLKGVTVIYPAQPNKPALATMANSPPLGWL